MSSKELKFLAKLATSALALSMLGINEPISAMEQASGELSDEQKKQVEQKLDGILEKLNKEGETDLENLKRKANFLNLMFALLTECSHSTLFHENIFKDLKYSVCESKPNCKFVKFQCLGGAVGTVKDMDYLTPNEFEEVLPFVQGCFNDFCKYSKDQREHLYLHLRDACAKIPEKEYKITRDIYSSEQNYANAFIRAIHRDFRFFNKEKSNTVVNCPICLESLKTLPISKLACGHQLHDKCLNELISKKIGEYRRPQCPICRQYFAKCEIENGTNAEVRHMKSKSLPKKLKMNI